MCRLALCLSDKVGALSLAGPPERDPGVSSFRLPEQQWAVAHVGDVLLWDSWD